jgi:lipopolysaccharide/colanic/teichoic acid biosynthesis glycosyltransferase
MMRDAVKRALDVAGAVVGLVISAPLLGAAALLVRLGLGAPVLFRQSRLGLDGKPFTLDKLRTMTDQRDADGNHLPSAQRLTPLGKFLRGTSLDELPELFNVLAGDMSLVGPRPLLPRYLHRYTPEQARRHHVKPGITGWAQVHGRNTLGWEQRFALDCWYVDHRSVWLDVRILALTPLKVLRRDGISPAGQDIMPEFRGSVAPGTPPPSRPVGS